MHSIKKERPWSRIFLLAGLFILLAVGCSNPTSTGTGDINTQDQVTITSSPAAKIMPEETCTLAVTAHPYTGQTVQYAWSVVGGDASGALSSPTAQSTVYTAPTMEGSYTVACTVAPQDTGGHVHSVPSQSLPTELAVSHVSTSSKGSITITVTHAGMH